MTTRAEQSDPDLRAIMSERRQLINVAYRLLGSLADAEDVVQETYARWCAMSAREQQAIESPGAWLVTVASRICLTMLRSARVRRETYAGDWIPEPLPEPTEWITGSDPGDRVTLDESWRRSVRPRVCSTCWCTTRASSRPAPSTDRRRCGCSTPTRLASSASRTRRFHLRAALYSASKAAATMLTVQYAKAHPGITFNALEPGFTATDMTAGFEGGRSPEESARTVVRLATLGADGQTGTFQDEAGVLPW